jgi:hypothetical protein
VNSIYLTKMIVLGLVALAIEYYAGNWGDQAHVVSSVPHLILVGVVYFAWAARHAYALNGLRRREATWPRS